jgi:hypothetical protein
MSAINDLACRTHNLISNLVAESRGFKGAEEGPRMLELLVDWFEAVAVHDSRPKPPIVNILLLLQLREGLLFLIACGYRERELQQHVIAIDSGLARLAEVTRQTLIRDCASPLTTPEDRALIIAAIRPRQG